MRDKSVRVLEMHEHHVPGERRVARFDRVNDVVRRYGHVTFRVHP